MKIKKRQPSNIAVCLIVIMVLGLALRIIGYDWGGNRTIFQPDEFHIIDQIRDMVESQSFLHHHWTYPSRCTSQILAWILMLVSKTYYLSWIEYYYVIRIAYVLFSTFNIWLSYKLVEKCENPKIALYFSFLVAINPIFIKYAKQAVGDTPVLMFWLIVAIFVCEYIESSQIKHLVLMSFFAACALMEKWNGGGITILIAIVVIYHNLHDLKKLFIHGSISLFTWIASLFVIEPTLFITWDGTFGAISSATDRLGSSLIQEHLIIFFSYVGIGAVILAILGFYYSFICDRSDRKKLVTCIPGIITIISLVEDWFLCSQVAERHGLVVYWGCTLFILMGACFLLSLGGAWKTVSITVLLFAIILWLLDSAVINATAVIGKHRDTREVGLTYLKEIGASIENSTGEPYTPFHPLYADETMEIEDINEILFYDEENGPCITIPNKRYVIIGQYAMANRVGDGYKVLHQYGTLIKRFDSDENADLFSTLWSYGKWYYLELDTLRNVLTALHTIISAETIGPWIEVYDVSSFTYLEK